MPEPVPLQAYNTASAFDAVFKEDEPLFGVLLLRDKALVDATEIERHFNDLYHLFLNKFARLSHLSEVSAAEEKALKDLLDELLRVKKQFTE